MLMGKKRFTDAELVEISEGYLGPDCAELATVWLAERVALRALCAELSDSGACDDDYQIAVSNARSDAAYDLIGILDPRL